jgi:hypothetical protein
MLTYPNFKDHTFQNGASSAANGTALKQNDAFQYKTLTVEIYGTEENTARTVTFYCKGASGTLRPLAGTKISAAPLSVAVSTTGTGEVWQFDITGLSEVIMDLTAITGGTVTVKGRAVS